MDYPTCPRDQGKVEQVKERPEGKRPQAFAEHRTSFVWRCENGHDLEPGEDPIWPS